MSATILILLLIIAIGLVLIEIFIIPGVGIAGIIGALLMVVALFLAYEIGTSFGHYTLASTILVSIGLLALTFRANTWERISLKSNINAHVESNAEGLSVGDKGLAVSRINPMGKAFINERYVEVSSKGDYIDAQSPIEIITIDKNKIIVKQV